MIFQAIPTNTITRVVQVLRALKRRLLRPLPDNDFALTLDNSAGEKFTTCPRAAEYYLVEGRESIAKSPAINFGGALHAALELLHKGAPPADQDRAIVDYYTNYPAPPDEYRNQANALTVMSHYRDNVRIREDYKWEILSDEEGPIIERPFELPLGVIPVNSTVQLPDWPEPKFIRNVHIIWSGRIDVVTKAIDGIARVTDNKTTSIGDDKFIQDFQLATQTIGYVWAGRQLWPSLNIRGFCLNAIWFRRPTGIGSFVEKGPRGGEPALKFFRSYFEYVNDKGQQELIDEWITDCQHMVSDFLHSLVRNYFVKYTKWCFGKYGRCQYHDVCCHRDPEVRYRYLHSEQFKDVTWDPVAGH